MERFGIQDKGRPADKWLCDTARLCWRAKLSLHVESDLMQALRERAEAGAITVFADNLRDLLLAAPAGPKTILGLDPGLRTGCKVAVVDRTGKLLATGTARCARSRSCASSTPSTSCRSATARRRARPTSSRTT
jgi:uncharacterized protein